MRGYLAGIGLRGPGLPGWAASVPVLTGQAPWEETDLDLPPPALLPPNERRRAGPPVRLALAVAEEAVGMARLAPDAVRGVFASGNGDGAIVQDLLRALTAAEPAVSPTQFHNSVHNAVAGYWAMAAGSRQPVTCLGAHDDTLAAALLKALAEVSVEREPVLCCVYDVPIPAPLGCKRPVRAALAFALVLLPDARDGVMASLDGGWCPGRVARESPPVPPILADHPAAGMLPLLAALAAGLPGQSRHPMLDGVVTIDASPCSAATAF